MTTMLMDYELRALAVNENYEDLNQKRYKMTYRDRYGFILEHKGTLIATQCASGRMRLGFKIDGSGEVEIVSAKGEVNEGVRRFTSL